MKKKLIIALIIVAIVLSVGIVAGLSYKKYSNNKRYETIKTEIEEEAKRYLKVSHPNCTPGSGSFTMNEDALLVQWAMDKKKLLDVDGKSYCKTRIEVTCVATNELDIEVYIKCKDYEDENYSNWEERGQNTGNTTNAFKKVSFNDKEQKIINLINTKLNINQYFKTEELESFEIINLSKFGYYESEKNILYVIVYYTSKCKNGTYSCDYLDNSKASNVEFNKPFSFLIKVDVENFDFIEKLNGFAAHINSDWKYVSGRIN